MRTRSRTNYASRTYHINTVTAGNSCWSSYITYTPAGGTSKKYYPPYLTLLEAIYGRALLTPRYLSLTDYPSSEVITDVGGKPSRSKVLPWNPVDHTVTEFGFAPYEYISKGSTQTTFAAGSGQIPQKVASVPAAPQLSALLQTQLYAECYNAMLPDFESDTSLANFLFELKDFKGLYKLIRKNKDRLISGISKEAVSWAKPLARPVRGKGESLADFRDRESDWKKRYRLRTGKFYVLDKASELDLSYHYVVRPFVNDVAEMSIMWDGLRNAIRKMNHQGRVRNVHHASRTENVSVSYASPYVTCKRNEYRMQGELTYRLRPMSMLETFMSYSGLRLNAKKLWDAVPFSFVLDRYTTFGEAFGAFDRSDVIVNMTRLMESVTSRSCVWRVVSPDVIHFKGGTAGPYASMLAESSYGTYHPLTWTAKSTYKRQLIDVPYVRPPIIPRLKMPTCEGVRKDLDLVYQLFARGGNPAWRQA